MLFEVSKLDIIGGLFVSVQPPIGTVSGEPLAYRVPDQRVFVYSITGGSCSAVSCGADSEASSDLLGSATSHTAISNYVSALQLQHEALLRDG